MNGILIVNKPQDWTSFDVVAKIRSLTKVKKIGHSGTLDPMATGVLPVFLGRATKSIQYFLNGDKGYAGEMVLGVTTDTGDATGKTLTRLNFNHRSSSSLLLPQGEGKRVREVFEKFTGEIEQIPPMYSAVKIKGKKLYELARKGIIVKREPRKVTIFALRLTHYDVDGRITFYVECSKGTYIRQLVVDIGEELGCGAHLSRLERVYSHPFRISQALPLETIINLAKIGKLESVVIPVEEILDEQRTS